MEHELSSEVADYWQELEANENELTPNRRSGKLFLSSLQKPEEKPRNVLRFEETIKSLREENIVEENRITDKEKKETRVQIVSLVKDLQQEFEFQIGQARAEYNKMLNEIADRKVDIAIISRYIGESEFIITQTKLFRSFYTRKQNYSNSIIKKNSDGLTKDIFYIKLALDGMKDGIKKYRNDTENTYSRIIELQQKLINTKEKNEIEIKRFEAEG